MFGKLAYGLFALVAVFLLSSCNTFGDKINRIQDNRSFTTSFESVSDFADFYIVPQGNYDSNHELSTEQKVDGSYSHKAWITGPRAVNNDGLVYLPHRAYPTIQLYKTSSGSFVTPCLVSFWAYLDMSLVDRSPAIDDWFSFATLTPDTSDNWSRTVLVNIAPDGYLRLVHVPNQGEQDYLYQVSQGNNPDLSLKYPYKQWVKIDIYIDFSKDSGYAKVWQNGTLVSHALVNGGNQTLAQAHFGLYAAAAVGTGSVYNDSLSIREVANEESALEILGY